jgi:hypothetical protein
VLQSNILTQVIPLMGEGIEWESTKEIYSNVRHNKKISILKVMTSISLGVC